MSQYRCSVSFIIAIVSTILTLYGAIAMKSQSLRNLTVYLSCHLFDSRYTVLNLGCSIILFPLSPTSFYFAHFVLELILVYIASQLKYRLVWNRFMKWSVGWFVVCSIIERYYQPIYVLACTLVLLVFLWSKSILKPSFRNAISLRIRFDFGKEVAFDKSMKRKERPLFSRPVNLGVISCNTLLFFLVYLVRFSKSPSVLGPNVY